MTSTVCFCCLQRVDNYEYELPSDFEDEEIDEDEAFGPDDDVKLGHLLGSKRKGKHLAAGDAPAEPAAEDTGDTALRFSAGAPMPAAVAFKGR